MRDEHGRVPRDLTVCDMHGLRHVSVLIEEPAASYLVALCAYFEAVDAAVVEAAFASRIVTALQVPAGFSSIDTSPKIRYPAERWAVDQEAPGVPTCLRCARC